MPGTWPGIALPEIPDQNMRLARKLSAFSMYRKCICAVQYRRTTLRIYSVLKWDFSGNIDL